MEFFDERLRELSLRRSILEKKAALRGAIFQQFSTVRNEYAERGKVLADKKIEHAKDRNRQLLNDISLTTAQYNNFIGKDAKVKKSDQMLLDSKIAYRKAIDSLLPSYRQRQSIKAEEQIRVMQQEKIASIQRRNAFSNDQDRAERIHAAIEMQRRELVLELALEQGEKMKAVTQVLLMEEEGRAVDAAIVEEVSKVGQNLQDILLNSKSQYKIERFQEMLSPYFTDYSKIDPPANYQPIPTKLSNRNNLELRVEECKGKENIDNDGLQLSQFREKLKASNGTRNSNARSDEEAIPTFSGAQVNTSILELDGKNNVSQNESLTATIASSKNQNKTVTTTAGESQSHFMQIWGASSDISDANRTSSLSPRSTSSSETSIKNVNTDSSSPDQPHPSSRDSMRGISHTNMNQLEDSAVKSSLPAVMEGTTTGLTKNTQIGRSVISPTSTIVTSTSNKHDKDINGRIISMRGMGGPLDSEDDSIAPSTSVSAALKFGIPSPSKSSAGSSAINNFGQNNSTKNSSNNNNNSGTHNTSHVDNANTANSQSDQDVSQSHTQSILDLTSSEEGDHPGKKEAESSSASISASILATSSGKTGNLVATFDSMLQDIDSKKVPSQEAKSEMSANNRLAIDLEADITEGMKANQCMEMLELLFPFVETAARKMSVEQQGSVASLYSIKANRGEKLSVRFSDERLYQLHIVSRAAKLGMEAELDVGTDVIADTVLEVIREWGTRLLPSDIFVGGIVTLDRLNKDHKRSTGVAELWKAIITHVYTLTSIDNNSLENLATTFTNALICQHNKSDEARLMRKVLNLFKTAILSEMQGGVPSINSPLRSDTSNSSFGDISNISAGGGNASFDANSISKINSSVSSQLSSPSKQTTIRAATTNIAAPSSFARRPVVESPQKNTRAVFSYGNIGINASQLNKIEDDEIMEDEPIAAPPAVRDLAPDDSLHSDDVESVTTSNTSNSSHSFSTSPRGIRVPGNHYLASSTSLYKPKDKQPQVPSTPTATSGASKLWGTSKGTGYNDADEFDF